VLLSPRRGIVIRGESEGCCVAFFWGGVGGWDGSEIGITHANVRCFNAIVSSLVSTFSNSDWPKNKEKRMVSFQESAPKMHASQTLSSCSSLQELGSQRCRDVRIGLSMQFLCCIVVASCMLMNKSLVTWKRR